MEMWTNRMLSGVCAVLVAGLFLVSNATAQAQEYRLTDLVNLGFIPNPDVDGTLGINNRGEVVYAREVGGVRVAWFWLPQGAYGHPGETIIDLSSVFPTANPSIARDINVDRKIAGQVDGTGLDGEAIVWDLAGDSFQPLGVLPDATWSRAIAIDDASPATVVGESETVTVCPDPPACGSETEVLSRTSFYATLTGGTPALIELGPLTSEDCDQTSLARDVVFLLASGDPRIVGASTSQQVAGSLCPATDPQCGEPSKDAASFFPTLAPLVSLDADRPSEGRGVNALDQGVGWGYRAAPAVCLIDALFWDDPASPINLRAQAMPPSHDANDPARAEAINNADPLQVVGWNTFENRTIVWEHEDGPPWDEGWTAKDPNDLVPECSTGEFFQLREAHDINDDGWIITWGEVFNDQTGLIEQHAYLLTPIGNCPEDVNRDCVVNVLDLIDLLLQFGEPCVPAAICWTDITLDCVTNVLDLIALLEQFGTVCTGCTAQTPKSLEEELAEVGLTMDDWDDFMDVMENGTPEEQENYKCWMIHYLSECPTISCPPNCPGSDPFGRH